MIASVEGWEMDSSRQLKGHIFCVCVISHPGHLEGHILAQADVVYTRRMRCAHVAACSQQIAVQRRIQIRASLGIDLTLQSVACVHWLIFDAMHMSTSFIGIVAAIFLEKPLQPAEQSFQNVCTEISPVSRYLGYLGLTDCCDDHDCNWKPLPGTVCMLCNPSCVSRGDLLVHIRNVIMTCVHLHNGSQSHA